MRGGLRALSGRVLAGERWRVAMMQGHVREVRAAMARMAYYSGCVPGPGSLAEVRVAWARESGVAGYLNRRARRYARETSLRPPHWAPCPQVNH